MVHLVLLFASCSQFGHLGTESDFKLELLLSSKMMALKKEDVTNYQSSYCMALCCCTTFSCSFICCWKLGSWL